MDAAARAGVRVGSAPDTVLGTGTQTARAAIDSGRIGRPIAATAVMITPGHESWHPNPGLLLPPGGGPLLDMGPYYVAALIQLLGPVRSVVGSASSLRPERTITSGDRAGERIPVEVQTHVSGVFEHHSGALSTITTSFDGVATTAAPIEVHGERAPSPFPTPTRSTAKCVSSRGHAHVGGARRRGRVRRRIARRRAASTSSRPGASTAPAARAAMSPCTASTP